MKVTLELSLSTILEIISKTSNSEVATQLFEGTYKEPQISQSAWDAKANHLLSFESFDKWTNKVTYSFPTYRWYNENGTDWKNSKSEGYENKQSSGSTTNVMSLRDWNTMSIPSEQFSAPKDLGKLVEFTSESSNL